MFLIFDFVSLHYLVPGTPDALWGQSFLYSDVLLDKREHFLVTKITSPGSGLTVGLGRYTTTLNGFNFAIATWKHFYLPIHLPTYELVPSLKLSYPSQTVHPPFILDELCMASEAKVLSRSPFPTDRAHALKSIHAQEYDGVSNAAPPSRISLYGQVPHD